MRNGGDLATAGSSERHPEKAGLSSHPAQNRRLQSQDQTEKPFDHGRAGRPSYRPPAPTLSPQARMVGIEQRQALHVIGLSAARHLMDISLRGALLGSSIRADIRFPLASIT